MSNENTNPVITNIISENLKMEITPKKHINPKDVVATGAGIGAGVVAYEVAKELFPIIVEKIVEIVKKHLGKLD